MQISCHYGKAIYNNDIGGWVVFPVSDKWFFWQTVSAFANWFSSPSWSLSGILPSADGAWRRLFIQWLAEIHTGEPMANDRSFLVRFFYGIWHFINGSRKVFLNLLFLLFIFVVFTALQPPETFRLKPDSSLVIRPYGNVVEQFTTTPMDRAIQEATGVDRSETRRHVAVWWD